MSKCPLKARVKTSQKAAHSVFISLSVENFLSIRDQQTIDLRVADNVPQEDGRLVSIYPGSPTRVPLVVAFFGANGAGKSNILRALSFLVNFIKDSFANATDTPFPFAPFSDDESQSRPTKFSLSFSATVMGDQQERDSEDGLLASRYTYDLEIAWIEKRVIRETLTRHNRNSRRPSKVFDREESDVVRHTGLGLDSSYRMAIDKVLRPDASLISTLAQLNHPLAMELRDLAQRCTSNISTVKFEGTDEHIAPYYSHYKPYMDGLNRELPRLDIGITRAFIEPDAKMPIIKFEHEGLNRAIPSTMESHGTRQFVRLFPFISYAMERGSVAIIDELDSSLHPAVLPLILSWFQDPRRNPNRAQLWITCHSASLLESLSKEEIFFCEKDRLGRTGIFALSDVRGVRRIDNFYRKYLGGVYGAVPRLG
jgi:hypothetical protein